MRKTVTKEAAGKPAKSVKAAVKETSKDELAKEVKTRKAITAKAAKSSRNASRINDVVEDQNENEDLFHFAKGKAAIRAEFTEFQDKSYLNIREYYQDEDGEWQPTKKGFTVPSHVAHRFAKELLEFVRINPDK